MTFLETASWVEVSENRLSSDEGDFHESASVVDRLSRSVGSNVGADTVTDSESKTRSVLNRSLSGVWASHQVFGASTKVVLSFWNPLDAVSERVVDAVERSGPKIPHAAFSNHDGSGNVVDLGVGERSDSSGRSIGPSLLSSRASSDSENAFVSWQDAAECVREARSESLEVASAWGGDGSSGEDTEVQVSLPSSKCWVGWQSRVLSVKHNAPALGVRLNVNLPGRDAEESSVSWLVSVRESEHVIVVRRVDEVRETRLLEVAEGLGVLCRFLRLSEDWEQDGGEDRDDGDNDEEFNKRECFLHGGQITSESMLQAWSSLRTLREKHCKTKVPKLGTLT